MTIGIFEDCADIFRIRYDSGIYQLVKKNCCQTTYISGFMPDQRR